MNQLDKNSIDFSGWKWNIKEAANPIGPGPNYYVNSSENIFVDALNNLHLKIVNQNGIWACSEIISKNTVGYGHYVFNIKSRIDLLDDNTVLGMFLWDSRAENEYNHEIDIELSKWHSPENLNAQFVVQPNTNLDNIKRFKMNLFGNYSSFSIDWYPDRIIFNAYHGHIECGSKKINRPINAPIQTWVYKSKNVPVPNQSNIRLNLWLMDGKPPQSLKDQEVIINCVSYTPF